MPVLETLLSLALGISLAAAAGFRIFVPVLVVAIAARAELLPLAPNFAWLSSNVAIAMLAIAAMLEIVAYYVPGFDNLLDTIATPIALVAGILMVAAPLWELSPVLKWTLAVIAGGGAAGATQSLTSLIRAKSTLATGGIGNPVVSTAELGSSALLSVMAILLPVAALLLLVVVLVLFLWRLRRIAPMTV